MVSEEKAIEFVADDVLYALDFSPYQAKFLSMDYRQIITIEFGTC